MLFFCQAYGTHAISPFPSPHHLSNKDNGRRGFSKQHTIHAHTPGPSRMTLTVFGPSRFLPLAAPPHNSAKDDKGRTHAKRRPTVGPSDPSLGQGGGPKGRCSAQPSHRTTTPSSNLGKKAGEPTPLRGQKGVSNTPEPSQPLHRETKGIRR